MKWNEFVDNVQNWSRERGIYEHSTPDAQLLKALSEVGELADAYIKQDAEGIVDGIGDIAVCLVNHQTMVGGDTGAIEKRMSSWAVEPAVAIGHIAFCVGVYIGQERSEERRVGTVGGSQVVKVYGRKMMIEWAE